MNKIINGSVKTRAILLFGFLVITVLLSWRLLVRNSEASGASDAAASNIASIQASAKAAADHVPAGSAQEPSLPAAQVVHGVHLSSPIDDLLADVPEGAGGLAVADDDGNLYFTKVDVRDQAQLWRQDVEGDVQMLWSTPARGRHIEIAGREGKKLTLIFPAAPLQSAADAWRHDGSFFRIDILTPAVGVWPDHGQQQLKAHFAKQ